LLYYKSKTLPPFETLKPPSQRQYPAYTLVDLPSKQYVKTIVRVVIVKARQKEDELGSRRYLFGIAEDSTFRLPFICYKPYPSFFKDGVFEFKGAYVHEFEDKSQLLILSEYAKITYLPDEDPRRYFWNPTIADIKKPLGSCKVTLQGIISQIKSSSGLIHRCDKCGRVAYEEQCPQGHSEGLHWAARISGRISDRTGSINIILPQYLTCKILGRPIAELLQLSTGKALNYSEFKFESFSLQLPERISINEALVDSPDEFRSAKSPVAVDHNEARIYYPNNITLGSAFSARRRDLDLARVEDRRVLLRLVGRLLDMKVHELTKLPRLNGIQLLEEPIELYHTERAKVYLGFKTNLSFSEDGKRIILDALPACEIFESLLDYIRWRRGRGASVCSIRNSILNYRRNIILSPEGQMGYVVDLVFKTAGEFIVPGYDLPLPGFWKKIHNLEVQPEEKPLIVVKPYRLDLELTYPASCVFLDQQSIPVRSSIERFIEYKKANLRRRVKSLLEQAFRGFTIGDYPLALSQDSASRIDAKRLLLNDIKERLLGKTIKATGSVIEANGKLYFIPRTVEGILP
jgi:hypothetical protein